MGSIMPQNRTTLSFVIASVFFISCSRTPVTGKPVFIITSETQEIELGSEAYKQTLSKERVSTRNDWNQTLEKVAKRIAAVAERPNYQWEFKLIESAQKNAFCLPGGKIAVYTGMLKVMDNEAQLAAVLGHEVAHATARHAGQRITLQFGQEITFASLSAFLGGPSSTGKTLLFQALGLGAQVGAVLPFGRSQESEADHIGLIYMAMAGYDPKQAVTFWENFASHSHGGPPEWLSTHPASEKRAQHLKEKLPEADAKYSGSAKLGSGEPIPH